MGKYCWKNGMDGLVHHRVATTFNLKKQTKNPSAKCKNISHACNFLSPKKETFTPWQSPHIGNLTHGVRVIKKDRPNISPWNSLQDSKSKVKSQKKKKNQYHSGRIYRFVLPSNLSYTWVGDFFLIPFTHHLE